MTVDLEKLGEGKHRKAYRIKLDGVPSGLVLKVCKTPTDSANEMLAMRLWKNDPIIAPHLPMILAYDAATGMVLMPEYGKAKRRDVRALETHIQTVCDKPSILLVAKQIGSDVDGKVILQDMGEMLPRRKKRTLNSKETKNVS